ncbi:MAG TPA: hypothetical protein VL309_12050 [Vicinamibacterales bacterium]|jgi:hypothetical protein|nr:hypothetical protein [Vicinamibacterales bacterium]
MHECFADEIAIDFPSVGHVVDRMRDAFLGEPADAGLLTREVSLSSREALDGRVVPVEVPIRTACATCGGRGETWTERCPSCRGSGDALVCHTLRVTVPPGVAHGACFRFRVTSPHASAVRVEVRVVVRSSAA